MHNPCFCTDGPTLRALECFASPRRSVVSQIGRNVAGKQLGTTPLCGVPMKRASLVVALIVVVHRRTKSFLSPFSSHFASVAGADDLLSGFLPAFRKKKKMEKTNEREPEVHKVVERRKLVKLVEPHNGTPLWVISPFSFRSLRAKKSPSRSFSSGGDEEKSSLFQTNFRLISPSNLLPSQLNLFLSSRPHGKVTSSRVG